MKKQIFFFIIFLTGFFFASAQKQGDKNDSIKPEIDAGAWLSTFLGDYHPDLKCHINNYKENSYNIVFDDNSNVRQEEFFTMFSKQLGIRLEDTWQQYRVDTDYVGMTHYRYQQYYKGIKVMGGEMLLHTKNGYLTIVNGNFYNNLNINTVPVIDGTTAIQSAMKEIGAEKWMWENPNAENFLKETTEDSTVTYTPKTELLISPTGGIYDTKNFRLCYKTNIASEQPFSLNDVYIDAISGIVVNKLSQIQDATGNATTLYSGDRPITTDFYNGKYRLRDYTRGNGIITYDNGFNATILNPNDFTDVDNTWAQEIFLKQVVVYHINNNWEDIGESASSGDAPDIFFWILDANNTIVYESETRYNTNAPVAFNLTLQLNNPPYTLKVWDRDLLYNDLIGTFNINTTSGINNYTDNMEVNGQYTISIAGNPALDVHWGMEKTYDFYLNKLGRNSYDNSGAKIKNYINLDNNAFNTQEFGLPNSSFAMPWPLNIMVFGLGDGEVYNPIVSLDVMGHEFTHLVINNTANLKYQGESGALNESFADIFGTAIEYYGKEPASGNWTIGEEFIRRAPYYLRSMSNPKSSRTTQPDTYLKAPWDFGNTDHGGVHTNCGVQNFWFYLLSHGGNDQSPNDNGDSYNVTAIGIDHATNIAYRNLIYYLTSNANYENAVYGSKNAATDLYGSGSQEELSVLNAWYAVGLYNNPLAYCSGTINYTDPSGTFDDGSGNSNYQNNADCKWLIIPNGAISITLNFTSFSTEATNDKVIVYDGSAITDPILGTFSGSSIPSSVSSTGSAMLVRFITNASTVQQGWSATYTSAVSSNCNGQINLSSTTGNFSDGSGSNNYSNNSSCRWLISPPGATSITLSFSAFNLLSGDTVKVFNGTNTSSPLLNKYSGTSIPSNQAYPTGEILVQFISNSSGTAAGFDASYTSAGSGFCSPNNNLTAVSGTFSDGSGTQNYYNHTDCEWLIQPAGAMSITLNFDAFDLELPGMGGNGVIYDWVKIYDGSNSSANLIGTYTGSTSPPTITSTGGSLFIQFHTDGATTAQGWTAHYTSTNVGYCSGTTHLTTATGSFADGSGSSNYENNADCKWLIEPANATSIILNFSSFDTELNYDGVIVYDGSSYSSPVIDIFTGSNIPHQVNSTGGTMLVRFMSDGATTAQGWNANYIANISPSGGNNGGLTSIHKYEYWFDDDYANKVTNNVIPVHQFSLNSNIPTNSLNPGLHCFHIRFMGNQNLWSSIVSEFFNKLPVTHLGSRVIVAYEYWFDNDYANKILLAVTNLHSFNLVDEINTSSLSSGLHSYHIRYKDDAGQWSSVVSEFFNKNGIISPNLVNAYRYWFDMSDVNMVTVNLPVPINPLSLITEINTCNLVQGSHTVHFQFRDIMNQWSCVTTDTFTKTLPVIPVITSGGPLTFCQGRSVTLTSTSGSSYRWSTGETTQGITVSTPGSYSVTVVNAGGCSVSSNSVSVAVNPLPSIPTVTPNGVTTFCQGGTVRLSSSAANSYLWSNGLTTQSINVTTPGNYIVTVSNSYGCSSTSVGTSVTVNSLPTATIIPGGTTTFCLGDSVILISSTANSYHWSNGSLAQSTTARTTGNYIVTVTDGNNCSATASRSVTVNPLPTATITPSGVTTFCQGDSVILTSGLSNSYHWSNGETTKSITVRSSDNYIVTITDGNVCSATASRNVTVNPLPTAIITPSGATTFCQGDSVILTSSLSNSYHWSNGATTRSITARAPGNYIVTNTDGNGCSGVSPSRSVFVNPIPTATITPSGPTTFCQGDSVILTSISASTFLWNNGLATRSITIRIPGNYLVTITDGNGCSGNSSTVTVNVNPLPVLPQITGDSTMCFGQSSVLTVSNPCSGCNYSWSNTMTGQNISVDTAGTYIALATNNCGTSAGSNSITIVVNSLPIATITPGGSTTFCLGDSVLLSANTSDSYHWNNGVILQNNTVRSSGNYIVTITDANGCSGTSSAIPVTVNNPPAAQITISGSTSFCQGDSVILTASPSNFYLWSNGDITQSITVRAQNNYSLTITDGNGCSGTSNEILIVVYNLPLTPVITSNGTTLTSSAASGNQWYLNTNTVLGATSQNYLVTQNGVYSVAVTDTNGCSSTSLPFNFNSINIENLTANNSIIIIPNPNNGAFRIVSNDLHFSSIRIYNTLGEIIYMSDDRSLEIDLSSQPKGIYFIELLSPNKTYNKKLIIQ